jgi:hypothetical protein
LFSEAGDDRTRGGEGRRTRAEASSGIVFARARERTGNGRTIRGRGARERYWRPPSTRAAPRWDEVLPRRRPTTCGLLLWSFT